MSAESEALPDQQQPKNDQQNAATVSFKLQFGKNCTDLNMPLSATVGDLKAKAQELQGIPPAMQKLLIKGQMHPDETTLQKAGVKKGLRVMLIGSSSANHGAWLGLGHTIKYPGRSSANPDSAQKVLDKGIPEGAMPGIAGRQVQLKDDENMIPGLLNAQGNKVRLTFKPAEQQVWIGSAATTQKVYYGQIKKIESHMIEGHEEYSMLAFHLNAEGTLQDSS